MVPALRYRGITLSLKHQTMKPDLKYFYQEWIRNGQKIGIERSIDFTNCLFNQGEFVLIISQTKKNPLSNGLPPVSVLRVFHTFTQSEPSIDSVEDIARLKYLFEGMNEDFNELYERVSLQHMRMAS